MTRLNQSRRQLVGYVYDPQVNNNVGTVQSERNMALVQEQAFDYNMEGDGFGDIVRGIFNKGKQGLKNIWKNKEAIVKKAEDAYTGETGTALRNLLPDSDDTADQDLLVKNMLFYNSRTVKMALPIGWAREQM